MFRGAVVVVAAADDEDCSWQGWDLFQQLQQCLCAYTPACQRPAPVGNAAAHPRPLFAHLLSQYEMCPVCCLSVQHTNCRDRNGKLTPDEVMQALVQAGGCLDSGRGVLPCVSDVSVQA